MGLGRAARAFQRVMLRPAAEVVAAGAHRAAATERAEAGRAVVDIERTTHAEPVAPSCP